ncbi:MAG: hypothetical protein ACXU8U_05235 [Asticcacaulis sp.]
MLLFAPIGLGLIVAAVCYYISVRVDEKRRRQGWRGDPFEKNEYTASKTMARNLRIAAIVCVCIAVAAAYVKIALP